MSPLQSCSTQVWLADINNLQNTIKITLNFFFRMSNIHDRVIREIGEHLNQEKFDVYTNPNQEKNAGIGDNYPDVILTEKGTRTVKFFMEVETVESVSSVEAMAQWTKYYNEINATFYLVVPVTVINKAKELCQKANVNARFTTYYEKDGSLIFDFQ